MTTPGWQNRLPPLPEHEFRLPEQHPNGVLFLTLSGSHMFGFSSPDSDFDIRGAHFARTRDILSLPALGRARETVTIEEPKAPGSEEMVTHEIEKFISLMVKNGGNFIEQVLCPYVIVSSDAHAALRRIAPKVLSKRHLWHYLGFARSQIALIRRRPDKETKIFLYIFRTLMSGIVAATEGVIEANLPNLCTRFDANIASPIGDVIEWKRATREENALYHEFSPTRLWRLVDDLEARLEAELKTSALPDVTSTEVIVELNDLLIEIRETVGDR